MNTYWDEFLSRNETKILWEWNMSATLNHFFIYLAMQDSAAIIAALKQEKINQDQTQAPYLREFPK